MLSLTGGELMKVITRYLVRGATKNKTSFLQFSSK